MLTSRAGLQCSTDPVFDGTMNAAAHLRRLETWAAGLWALSAVVAVVAALAGWGLVLGITLLVLVVSDVLLYTGEDPQFPRWLDRHEMGAVDRALFREGVALLGWALTTRPSPWTVVTAVTAVCVVHGAHVVYRAVTAPFARMDRARLVWRGLQVDGRTEAPAALAQPIPSPPPLAEGSQVVLQLDILVIVGLWVSWASMSTVPVRVMLVGVVLGAGAVAWRVLARYRLVRSLPLPEVDNARLYEALVDHAPAGRGLLQRRSRDDLPAQRLDRDDRPAHQPCGDLRARSDTTSTSCCPPAPLWSCCPGRATSRPSVCPASGSSSTRRRSSRTTT